MGAPYTTAKGLGVRADSIALARNQKSTGTAVAIHLSDNDADTIWRVLVKAHTSEGVYIVGTLVTRAPNAGDPKARVIGLAYVPGVLTWEIDVFGSPSKRTARFVLSTGPAIQNAQYAGTQQERALLDAISECCAGQGGGAFGLVPLNGSRVEREIIDTPALPPGGSNTGFLAPGPGALITRVWGTVDIANPTSFFGLVDSPNPVVGGEAWRVAPETLTIGTTNFTYPPFGLVTAGISFVNRPQWAISTTIGTVTLGAPVVLAIGAERL